jgi:hypothetical protein
VYAALIFLCPGIRLDYHTSCGSNRDTISF